MESAFSKLASLLDMTLPDAKKAYDGNKAAGTRVRLAMQEVKKLAQDVRNEITALKG